MRADFEYDDEYDDEDFAIEDAEDLDPMTLELEDDNNAEEVHCKNQESAQVGLDNLGRRFSTWQFPTSLPTPRKDSVWMFNFHTFSTALSRSDITTVQ